MADKPIIRNLETLRRDMVDDLRVALEALHAAETTDNALKLSRVESKIRNVLEFLTGSRE